MRQRITDAIAKALPAPEHGNRIAYDADLSGFGLRVTSAGARAWVLNYRARGIERRMTIGALAAWPAREARKRAADLLREIDAGGDPMAERHAERVAPTVTDLAVRYLEHATAHNRPRSVTEAKSLLDGIILPEIGKYKVEAIRRSDVEKLFVDVAKRAPIRANRMLSLLHRMMHLAEVWELREGPNPAGSIERNAETRRERYLDAADLARLLSAVSAHQNRQSANIIKLALLTGARRGELLGATWDQFDMARGIWSMPASLTKQKRVHTVPLNGPAIELLVAMKAEHDRSGAHNHHLFPGRGASGAQGDIKKSWASVCKSAGIEDLRFHDLRHAFASFLASTGQNLPLIGQLLGHSSPTTTARYAHLLLDPQRAATERVGAIIANGGKEGAAIVPMAGGRRA
ncbi:MAG: tyrosine-type recombinase/integrase [Acetobacteraceae bacterium]